MLIDPDASVAFLLHDVARAFRSRFDVQARSLGVTRAQWRVLLNLARGEGKTQSELADLLEVERITLCRMIDRMSDAGLVERRADPQDRRVWRLHLRPAAHAIVDRLTEIGLGVEETALADLDDAARNKLRNNLVAMRGALRPTPMPDEDVA